MTNRITRFVPLLCLVILSLLIFYKLSFTDLILARGDTYEYFYPYWDARHIAFRSGELPLWNPDIFMGIPLLANPQVGTYYPFNWLMTPFTAPDAIKFSIVLHIIIAGIGTFLFFWHTVKKSLIPAMTSAMVFAFGGYMIAHVEQINQLQGLAWLSWLLLALHMMMTKVTYGRYMVILAIIWSLQILSGHTQTVFISGIALGLYVLFGNVNSSFSVREKAFQLLQLVAVAILTVILSIPQLLPTLELTGMSNRGSGLTANQATAFSLPPNYLARALLPSYDGQLFTEYIGYIGVIALGLALFAILTLRGNKRSLVWLIYAIIGVLFAVGQFTPIYLNIAELPGFNLFRVPARWLALYAFGMAILAGQGILRLQASQRYSTQKFIVLGGVIALMAFARILPILQVDIVGSAQPTLLTIGSWAVSLLILGIVFFLPIKQVINSMIVIAIGIELFLASQIMPVNDLVPRDTYIGQRFTISQMLALSDTEISPRMFAISARLFNPGDVDALRAHYNRLGMDANAQQIAFTATKSQEIIAPNLNMTWGIPSIDGYGGGVLPTIYYTQFTSLLLPDNSLRTTDGRLGAMLSLSECRGACIPDLDMLRLTNTDYLITDKNFDVPYNGIFFDTSLNEYWSQIPQEPDFIFDEVHILFDDIPSIEHESFDFLGSIYYLAVTDWDTFEDVLGSHSDRVLGASVVNSRTATFQQLTPDGFERILSSDIKIYRLDSSSRAWLANETTSTPDDWEGHEEALRILRDSPETVVVHDAPILDGATGDAEIIQYSDTRVEIRVNSSDASYLYLADAYYPGWQATVNGTVETVHRANVMFRAVRVPAGESTVVFEFVPTLWYRSAIFGIGAWIVSCVLLGGLILRNRE